MARFPAAGGDFGSYALAVKAVQHVRKMRGGAQAHLMRAADGFLYVVKFQNNPQHLRVLANDYFATKLAELIGLPVPAVEIVEVENWLVDHTPDLHIEIAGEQLRCQPGLQFGSRLVIHPLEGQTLYWMEEPLHLQVRNADAFAGALVLDKWTCNADGRQAAFWKKNRERKYTASFIDQGYCFNAGEWTFPDSPLRGVFLRNDAYMSITGWDSFEPWLSTLENFDMESVCKIAQTIPPEWYDADLDALQMLIEQLGKRRSIVRRLIDEFRRSSRQPFPHWRVYVPGTSFAAADPDSRKWN